MFKKLIRNNFFYGAIIFLLVIFQLYFSFLYRNASFQLLEAQKSKSFYLESNQKLASSVAEYSSLSSVESRAKKMGFTENNNLVYLSE